MKKVVVAISGPPGAGSTSVGKILADRLNCNYFSPGRLWKDLASGKFNDKFYSALFLELCKKHSLVIPEMESRNDSHGAMLFWSTSLGKNPHLHKVIDELQVELSKKENIVIDGKLSILMIKNAHPKIWLAANLEERARRAARRDGIKFEEALEIVERRQAIEREEWDNIYGVDYWAQEKLADIVIDSSNLTPEEIADMIIKKFFNDKL